MNRPTMPPGRPIHTHARESDARACERCTPSPAPACPECHGDGVVEDHDGEVVACDGCGGDGVARA